MKINLDHNLGDIKDVAELTKALTQLFNKLQDDLHRQPEFLVVTSEDQQIPKDTSSNTVIFKFDETATVKTGYYDGENIVLPP
jgi:NRPS condensation-like uncharacterized protein